MKKLLLATLALTALTTTALAAPAPVTDFNKGEVSLGLNYDFNHDHKTVFNDPEIPAFYQNAHKSTGYSLTYGVSDNFALEYSLDQARFTERVFLDPNEAEYPLPKDQIAESEIKSATKLHRLSGIYKATDNLNVYASVDYARNKDVQSDDVYETSVTKNSQKGVSFGVVGHKKLSDHTEVFAKLGKGSLVKYEAAIGIKAHAGDNVDVSLFYNKNKLALKETFMNERFDRKHNGFNLAVNYKF